MANAKKVLVGACLGGMVPFVWSVVSWTFVPWHERQYLSFADQNAVAQVLVANAPQPGVYALPYAGPIPAGTSEAEARAVQAAFQERFKSGPIVLAAVRPRGVESVARHWVVAVATPMAVAFLLTWLLLQTTGLSYWWRVAFVVVAALAGASLVHLPYWNWWGFSTAYTAQALADVVEGWFLAGLVIARVAAPNTV